MNYYLTQMLTGHGSFGCYLNGIGKRANESCPHCGNDSDSLEHTLSECPAWHEKRTWLKSKLGLSGVADLTLDAVVEAFLQSEAKWVAFCQFAKEVILEEEEDERRRRRLSPSPLASRHSAVSSEEDA